MTPLGKKIMLHCKIYYVIKFCSSFIIIASLFSPSSERSITKVIFHRFCIHFIFGLSNIYKLKNRENDKDQKMCTYLKMNLTTKEIVPLMNISVRGVEVSRYRLRKKLGLESNVNLNDSMMKF